MKESGLYTAHWGKLKIGLVSWFDQLFSLNPSFSRGILEAGVMGWERLHKLMAQAESALRRACEAMIKEGRVQVNGEVVTELGTKVNPTKDTVSSMVGSLRLIPQT